MRAERRFSCLLLAAMTAGLSAPAAGFELFSPVARWAGAQATLHVGIPGSAASGVEWSTAMEQAASQWTEQTRFDFLIDGSYRDPCNGRPATDGSRPGDGLNGADFKDNLCSSDGQFGSSTVAVTLMIREQNALGTENLVEADIVFNDNRDFDIYDGPLTNGNDEFSGLDFRRTVLHELGHVLGLNHPPDDGEPAIMKSQISNLVTLQEDDIDGADFLYGGARHCDSMPLSFGRVDGSLGSGDCRVQDLMAGGSDDSPVDVYTLTLAEEMTVTASMRAPVLDSVLVLGRPPAVEVIDLSDGGGAGDCDARIKRTLPAGEYLVLANTWDDSPPPCGDDRQTTGDYELTLSYDDIPTMPELAGQQSFQGGRADATFHGGVTTDGGETFQNRVKSTTTLDVEARIEVDPAHQGQPGFIVVAAITDAGETLIFRSLGGAGDLEAYRPQQELVPVTLRRDALAAEESLTILDNIVPALIDINEIEVDFFVGYGIDAEPNELYFNAQPINLLVTPDSNGG